VGSEEGDDGAMVEARVYPQPLNSREKIDEKAIPYTFLSTKFLQDVGLDEGIAHMLAERNDLGWSFGELAELIEERV
jgi:hypothetical protein